MATCYAITQGEYSDWTVLAVFRTREMAEKQLPLWGGDKITEFPFNVTVPQPPANMTAFIVSRRRYDEDLPGELLCGFADASDIAVHKSNVIIRRVDARHCFPSYTFLHTYLYARDRNHAIKIASERFAKHDAIQAGIAC